jgi:undecaprenyl-diphosphatase
MKTNLIYFALLFSFFIGFSPKVGNCQSQGEVDFLKGINVRYPTDPTWKTISSTAKPLSIAIPFGMLAYSLISENKKLETDAYEAAASLVIAAAGTEFLKVVVKRPRPYVTYPNDIYPDQIDDGYSFPSGHVSMAFATATSVSLTSKKWYIAVPAFTWAVSVEYSRMYLGQHYPSDVIAGAIVGAASAYASHWLNKKYFSGKKKKLANK